MFSIEHTTLQADPCRRHWLSGEINQKYDK